MVRLNIEQTQAALKAPDISVALDAVNAYRDASREAGQAAAEALQQPARVVQETGKKLTQSSEGIADANMKTLESFKAAGEGAFTLARGIAFLSASSEKDFQRTLQAIARVQGAFDAFKGGIETIKGVVEATKVLTAYTQTLAVAQTAQATAATTATAAQTALSVAMGPVGIAIGATAAAVGLLALALRDSGEAALESADMWARSAESVEQLRNTRTHAIKTLGDETLSMRTATEQSARLTARYRELNSELAIMQRQAKEAAYGTGVAGAFGDQQFGSEQASRELALRKDMNDLLDEKARKQAAMGELEQKELERKEAFLRKDYESLTVIKEKLRAEEQRFMSADAAFAKMSQFDRNALENLSKAAQQRELTRDELLQLERVGGSQVSEYVRENLSDIGKAFGSREIFDRFKLEKSDKATLPQLQRENARLSAQLGVPEQMNELQLAQSVANRAQEMANERQRIATRTADLLDDIRRIDLDNEARIVKLEQEFKNRRKAVQ